MWARLPAARVNAAAALRSALASSSSDGPIPTATSVGPSPRGTMSVWPTAAGEAVIRQCGTAEPELAGHGALRRDGEADDVGGAGGGAGNADFDGWFTHGGQVWRRLASPSGIGSRAPGVLRGDER